MPTYMQSSYWFENRGLPARYTSKVVEWDTDQGQSTFKVIVTYSQPLDLCALAYYNLAPQDPQEQARYIIFLMAGEEETNMAKLLEDYDSHSNEELQTYVEDRHDAIAASLLCLRGVYPTPEWYKKG